MRSVREAGGIDEIVLVTGYLAEQVDAKLRLHQAQGLAARTVYNPFYEVANNLMSLWLARHEMDQDFMVTNGDNLFTPEVFRGLLAEAGEGIALALSKKRDFDHDDMRATLDAGLVARVSKKIADELSEAESPGLALVRGARARRLFREHLELLARRRESLKEFWLEVFNALYAGGVPVRPWFFDGEASWHEVDVHVDAAAVRRTIALKPREAAHAR